MSVVSTPVILVQGYAVTHNSPFLPQQWSQPFPVAYLFCLPAEGWPGWVSLDGLLNTTLQNIRCPFLDVMALLPHICRNSSFHWSTTTVKGVSTGPPSFAFHVSAQCMEQSSVCSAWQRLAQRVREETEDASYSSVSARPERRPETLLRFADFCVVYKCMN